MSKIKTSQDGATAGFPLQCQTNPPYRILVVNGDADICWLNVEGLRRHGYEVGIAADGDAGWLEMQTNSYNLLITENELPGLSGVGLVKKLRSANMPLPVIIAVETMPPVQSSQYPWLLRAHKLFKPYTVMTLLGLVKNVLRSTNDTAIKLRRPKIYQASRDSRLPTVEAVGEVVGWSSSIAKSSE
jgi:DNA-binding response OmpR family regulator